MTPSKTECQSSSFGFSKLEQRQVVADFSGGSITSDAGLVLIAQLDKQYQITQSFARGFKDERAQNRVQHTLEDLRSATGVWTGARIPRPQRPRTIAL
jgi:hypothetical protein